MSRADLDREDATQRRARVEEAAQIAETGGTEVSEQWRADAARYVAGEITADELVALTRARYELS